MVPWLTGGKWRRRRGEQRWGMRRGRPPGGARRLGRSGVRRGQAGQSGARWAALAWRRVAGSELGNGGGGQLGKYLAEVVALEQALVADLGVARLLLAVAVGLLLLRRLLRRRAGHRRRYSWR